MKKVLVVMAMVMGVGCMSAIAAETSVDSVACCQASQDEYKKIEVTEVPDVVKSAVEKAYAGQTIKEASVAEKIIVVLAFYSRRLECLAQCKLIFQYYHARLFG